MNQDVTKGTLELSGTGIVDVVPDIATLRISIVSERKTAAEAVSANAKDANAVIERLLALGLPRGDLQTEGLNLYPVYQTDPSTNVTTISGHRASNTVAVTAPLDLAGRALDVAVESGADESSGLTFGVRDDSAHRDKALERAVAAARKDAELVSRALGVHLLGPKTVTVTSGGGPVRAEPMRFLAKGATPVLGGSLPITASVQVVFEYSR